MPREPDTKNRRKTVYIDPALQRAWKRAQLNAEERGEDFPASFSEFIEMAGKFFLEQKHPTALNPPGPGRPRKK